MPVLDSRRVGRVLASVGLLLGPLLLLVDALIDPAWDAGDDVAYLADVAGSRSLYIVAEVTATVGGLFFVAGMLGVERLMRGPRVTLGQAAAALVTIGLIGQVGSLAFNIAELAMADFEDRGAIASFRRDLTASTFYELYWYSFVLVGFVSGSILLSIALLRERTVPAWGPVLLIVAVVAWFAGGHVQLVNAGSLALLTVALLPLARLVWSLSDEQWARWTPLERE